MPKETPQHKLLPIDQIRLDVYNPRIRRWLEMYGDEPTAEQLHLALGAGTTDAASSGTTYWSLQESIRANGAIIQPVVVNEADSVLTVIDGNTRVAIYLEFLEQKVPGDWTRVPAIVYRDLGGEEIDAIRLQAHLVGPRAWDPYSKAKYLDYLYTHEHFPVDRLVSYCGGRKREVEYYIRAYQEMEKYYRHVIPDDSAFEAKRFSGFVELQRPVVKDAILSAGFDLYDFSTWIHDRLIQNLNEVRMLPKILSREESRDTFLKEGARKAYRHFENPRASKLLDDLSLEQLCQALSRRIREMKWGVMKDLRGNPGGETAQALLAAADHIQELRADVFAQDSDDWEV